MKTRVTIRNIAACNIIIPPLQGKSSLEGLIKPQEEKFFDINHVTAKYIQRLIDAGDIVLVVGDLESAKIQSKDEELDEAKERAKSVGIEVDGRWSVERIYQEIDKKMEE